MFMFLTLRSINIISNYMYNNMTYIYIYMLYIYIQIYICCIYIYVVYINISICKNLTCIILCACVLCIISIIYKYNIHRYINTHIRWERRQVAVSDDGCRWNFRKSRCTPRGSCAAWIMDGGPLGDPKIQGFTENG